ncbi:MAG TPA: bifunctional hydroxymethylpyrimidine kinase/phosphomethylpyrimidine kinase [Methanothrix sp.]|nr:bifunctional hydroxymethylpyrimidine kinase/phosphomethylpyrimidine kinase [Methanothrix sp.]HRW83117.1 bifunctional hydroxymethylpyrimidine kinase/phosphomethylpyrimidine kinase [Methanothrix sp.]
MERVLLTVGGSDSSGGAGIQADIKTFGALGFHGTSAITAVTAQNTLGVRSVHPVPPEVVGAQLDALIDDFEISAAKTGMLHNGEIVEVAAGFFERANIPLVVDPVIEAEAGGRLLSSPALDLLCERLIPIATVATPNIFEAEAITGIMVSDEESAVLAGQAILDLGAEAAIITGGHLDGDDVLVSGEGHRVIRGERVAGGNHGVGCTYSAALTSLLAKGERLETAAELAKRFAAASVQRSKVVGRGASPVNPLGEVVEGAERCSVLTDLERGISILSGEPAIIRLIPEVGSNLGMAILGASGPEDVAAVEGRFIKAGSKVRACGSVKFGSSRHVARVLLSAMSFDPQTRAAMNVRFGEDVLETIQTLELTSSHFRREDEPAGSKTMSWGTEDAIRRFRSSPEFEDQPSRPVPQVIWDRGGVGKEPMVRLLGRSAVEVANLAVEIARSLQSDGNL